MVFLLREKNTTTDLLHECKKAGREEGRTTGKGCRRFWRYDNHLILTSTGSISGNKGSGGPSKDYEVNDIAHLPTHYRNFETVHLLTNLVVLGPPSFENFYFKPT